MQYNNGSGFISSALLSRRAIKEMREYVEYEKFLARTLIDNEDTKQFKENTQNLENSIYRHIYNNPDVEKLTVAGNKSANNN